MTDLHRTAALLVDDGKGILAADESIATMSRRLEAVGIEPTAESRRDYRELLVRTPDLSRWVSGIILCDETLRQRTGDGTPFAALCRSVGIAAGIKVDTGVTRLPATDGGVVTEGLDGLERRLDEYLELGAVFAKWRAVLTTAGLGRRTLHANAHALARYAALCQVAGIVPIVEPEFVMDGDHGIAVAQAITANTLGAVFEELDTMGVDLLGIVLKPNMVVPGTQHAEQPDPDEVAWRTVKVLTETVPASVPGIAFLSGGQSNERACAHLAAIHRRAVAGRPDGAPIWRLTYSFGRALVDDALRTWAGKAANIAAAQEVLAGNCERASAASAGRSPVLSAGG